MSRPEHAPRPLAQPREVRRSVEVEVDARVLGAAAALDLDLSLIAEAAIARAVSEAQAKRSRDDASGIFAGADSPESCWLGPAAHHQP